MEDQSSHHVTWDEETIALHDIDRGTRMKINEPDTPYHYYDEKQDEKMMQFPTDLNQENNLTPISPARSRSGKEESEVLEADELRDKLNKVQKKQDRKCIEIQSPSYEEGDDSLSFGARDAEGKLIHKDPKFTEKRKAHYNEFESVRAWKMAHKDEDEDDDVNMDSNEQEQK